MTLRLSLLLLAACTAEAPMDTSVEEQPLAFTFPLAERELFNAPVMGMDHDPVVQEGAWRLVCTNYNGEGYPGCYDEHTGSDFTLKGSFEAMDAGSTVILAGAAGTVVDVRDGNYDRCHGDLATLDVVCDGHPMVANGVIIEHEGGWRTRYWHMMNGQVWVHVGDVVEQGQALGLVGSSGYSSLPHLHFGLEDADGNDVDPFSGPMSQERSFWCDQGPDNGLPGGC